MMLMILNGHFTFVMIILHTLQMNGIVFLLYHIPRCFCFYFIKLSQRGSVDAGLCLNLLYS